MKKSKIYQVRKIHPPFLIKQLLWVFRDKELWGSKSAIGIWWNTSRGLKIANKNKELRYTMIGLYLGSYVTWIELTYLKKCKTNKGLSIPEKNIDNYIRNNQ